MLETLTAAALFVALLMLPKIIVDNLPSFQKKPLPVSYSPEQT